MDTIAKLNYVLKNGYKKEMCVYTFLSFFLSSLELAGLGLLVQFFAFMSDPNIEKFKILTWLSGLLSFKDTQSVFFILAGLVSVIFVLRALTAFLSNLYLQKFLHDIFIDLVHRMVSSTLNQSVEYHSSRNTNEIIHHIQAHSIHFIHYFLLPILMCVTEIFTVIMIAVFLCINSPLSTLLTVFFIGIVTVMYITFTRRKIKILNRQLDSIQVKMFSIIRNAVDSYKEIKLFGAKGYFFNKLDEAVKQYKNNSVKINLFNFGPKIFFESVIPLSLVLVGVLIFLNSDRQSSTIAEFLLLAMSIGRLAPCFSRLSAYLSTTISHTISLEIVFNTLEEARKHQDRIFQHENNEYSHSLNEISFKSVSFAYQETDEVLKDINLTIELGTKVGIVGRSGSGKSTLINLLLGFLGPTKGDILYQGKSIFTDIANWHSEVSYVPQLISLIDASIDENVAFGTDLKDIDTNKVNKALIAAELHNLRSGLMDNKLNEIELRKQMSGGQLQRLALARAFYKDAKVLIIDEGTSSLDVETEHNINQSIMANSMDKTVIFISHRLSALKDCDKIIILDEGKVAGVGTYNDLMNSSKWFNYINTLS